ncbi:MAG: sulfite exporter TauE/SafE family protein [Desulfovibrio sp.]|jgi:uncharacterized membrane protein YfcA|nr:sulfite exporter TauE/SafE family protein [Desulfovibrio sp.]
MYMPLALSSLFIGFIIGAGGVGGVLLIPALMFFGGLSTHQAMATALFSFFFTGIIATYIFQRYGSIHWKTTVPVLVGSLASSYAGASVNARLSSPALSLLLAGIVILSSLYSLRPAKGARFADRLDARGNFLLLMCIGLFTGFLCGMTGAGGGIVSTPVMLLFGYAVLPCIGTAQVLQSFVSAAGSLSNYSNGFIVFPLVWWVTVCELVGVALGVRVAHNLPLDSLKKYVTWFCLVIGLLIAARGVLE